VAKTQKLPLKQSVDEWKSEFADIYSVLKKFNFLTPSKSAKQVLCPNCNDHFIDVVFQNSKAYAVCDEDDAVGRMPINSSQLSQEKFDFEGFLTWMASASGLQTDIIDVASGSACRLGALGKSDNPATVYCIRVLDINKAVDFLGQLNDSKAVVFWFGEKPAVGQHPENIISLVDLILIASGELKVKKALLKPFWDEKVFAKSGDIELDKHIVLRRKKDKCFLLLNKKGNGFEKEAPIRPLLYRIIKTAHGRIKANPYGLKLDEFVYPRKVAENKRTISTGIKKINELCEEQGITQILTKNHEDRWGLNRVLGCCK